MARLMRYLGGWIVFKMMFTSFITPYKTINAVPTRDSPLSWDPYKNW